jgi:PIN domain nuclease of toxin-antitoxin system
LIAYLDTHVAIFVAEGARKQMSREAHRFIDRAELLVSPMVLIEMEILNEIRRIDLSARDIQLKLEHEIGLRVCTMPFTRVAEIALGEGWTRDPFDRIIVAQAKANGLAYLISADKEIAQNYPRTVW